MSLSIAIVPGTESEMKKKADEFDQKMLEGRRDERKPPETNVQQKKGQFYLKSSLMGLTTHISLNCRHNEPHVHLLV